MASAYWVRVEDHGSGRVEVEEAGWAGVRRGIGEESVFDRVEDLGALLWVGVEVASSM